ADRDDIAKAAAPIALATGVTRATDRPARAQMRLQVLLEDSARLHKQAAIDRLVRHLVSLVSGIRMLQPAGNLLGRPVLRQLGSDQLPQLFMPRELARLRSQGAIPRALVRCCSAIPSRAAVALELAANRRRCSPKTARNRSQRNTSSDASRDLFAIGQAQRPS